MSEVIIIFFFYMSLTAFTSAARKNKCAHCRLYDAHGVNVSRRIFFFNLCFTEESVQNSSSLLSMELIANRQSMQGHFNWARVQNVDGI